MSGYNMYTENLCRIFMVIFGSYAANIFSYTDRDLVSKNYVTVLKAGILLTNGSSLPYDFQAVHLGLEAAFRKVYAEQNILFVPVLYLYADKCSSTHVMGQTYYAGQDDVDLIIGPACTDDMMASLELQTYFKIPSITGAGGLVDTSAKFPYLTRCSYNTYTQWIFFTRLCEKFKWINIAVIFNRDDHANAVNANSLEKNLRNHPPRRSYLLPFSSKGLRGITDMQTILHNASMVSRVFVFLMDGSQLRQFMIQASKMGKLDGTYAFFSLDLFRDNLVQRNAWKQGDQYDDIAFDAFRSLLILTLRNTQDEPAYADFTRNIKDLAAKQHWEESVVLNYYVASFYDSVMLYGRAMGELLADGKSIKKDNVREVSQKYWNRTMPGATGRVYINPDGDRNDDHALYAMKLDGNVQVVAEFYGYKDITVPGYLFDDIQPIPWRNPTKTPPLDRPQCGFDGRDPICDKTMQRSILGVGISAALLFVSLVVIFRIRNVRSRKSEIAQLKLVGSWHDLDSPHFIISSGKISTATPCAQIGESLSHLLTNEECSHVPELSAVALEFGAAGMSKHAIGAMWKGSKAVVRLCEKTEIAMDRGVLKEILAARGLSHPNVLALQGVCMGPPRVAVMFHFCGKGYLSNLLGNVAVKLDPFFIFSFIRDVVRGLAAIQNSPMVYHGRLTSKCCYIDGQFTCYIADYGLPTLFERQLPKPPLFPDEQFYESLLWTPPEYLRNLFRAGTPEGDVYSLAIIMQESITRETPFMTYNISPSDIIAKLQHKSYRNFRPRLDIAQAAGVSPELLVLIKHCWAYNPLERPRMQQVRRIITEITKSYLGTHITVMDHLISKMEAYARDLEFDVDKKTQMMLGEKERSEKLLYRILPRSIADQLKGGIAVPPESYDSVSVQYSDIVSFTKLSSESTPTETVDLLNDLFILFDSCILKFDAFKVETIGDCYVVASGVPVRNGDQHCVEVSRLGLVLLAEIEEFKIRHRPNEKLRIRLGIHTGPCLAGVVGRIMPRFCLFGETILIAAKMESTSKAMRIQISDSSKKLLNRTGTFDTVPRERPVEINVHKAILTHWLNREIACGNSRNIIL